MNYHDLTKYWVLVIMPPNLEYLFFGEQTVKLISHSEAEIEYRKKIQEYLVMWYEK